MRPNLKSHIVLFCTLVATAGSLCSAETFETATGLDNTLVVSSTYKPVSFSTGFLEATYSRPLFGRWSVIGQYHMNLSNTLSSGIGGFAFDSDDLLTKSGAISHDGSAEVTKAPLWLFRGMIGFGIFRYIDTLESNNVALGSRNKIPVQADLYGLKFGTSVYKFFGDKWAASIGGSYSVASASSFGVSSTSFSVGVLYRSY